MFLTTSILVLGVSLAVIWYLKFIWSRKKLYEYSEKVDGPYAWPVIGVIHKFLLTKNVLELLNEMGHTYDGFYKIWFGPKLKYFIGRPEYIDIVCNNPNSTAKEESYHHFQIAFGQGVFVSKGAVWKNSRKILSAFLNQQNLQQYVDGSAKYSQLAANSIKEQLKKGETIDTHAYVVSITLNAVFDMIFGPKRPPSVTDSFVHRNFIEEILEGIWPKVYKFYFQLDFIYNMSEEGKRTNGVVKQFLNMINEAIVWKRNEYAKDKELQIEEASYQPRLIRHLIDRYEEQSDDPAVVNRQIRDEIFNFTVGGTDTTNTMTTFAILALGIFSDIQQKVLDEVNEVFGDSADFDITDVGKLKYLERVIKEVLRLFPIGSILGRTAESDIDLKDGNIIPEGAGIIIGTLYLHRNEKYWPDPLKFDPDRFLPENVANRHRATYIPFSHGLRSCNGLVYGMMGMKTIVATMVRNFVISSDYKSIEEITLNLTTLLRPKYGYKIHLTPRK